MPPSDYDKTYDDVREHIKDGYIVFFEAQTFKQKIITTITGGKYSHCGIATWMTDSIGMPRLMLIESTLGGCRLINLRSYANRNMTFLAVGLNWDQVSNYAIDKTGHVGYGNFDFISIGLKDLLTKLGFKWIAKFIKNRSGEVCSEMVADILAYTGKYDIYDTLISPSDLFTYLQRYDFVKGRSDTVARG